MDRPLPLLEVLIRLPIPLTFGANGWAIYRPHPLRPSVDRISGIIASMATVHIPEAEAARNFAAVMAHVDEGSEVVIERDARPVAVIHPSVRRPGLLLSEILARAKARGSSATLDGNFGRDLEEAINGHNEPLNPPEWD